jgi:biopolymer transport protein ExbD
MRTTGWRPSTAVHKRRTNYTSLLDGAGVVGTFVFFFIFLCMQLSGAMIPQHYSSSVDLATAATASPQPRSLLDKALMVYVTRDGRFYFQFTRVALEELPQLLRTACLRGAERKVYLRADARAKYGDVKTALDQISAAGIQNVAFMAEGPPHATR